MLSAALLTEVMPWDRRAGRGMQAWRWVKARDCSGRMLSTMVGDEATTEFGGKDALCAPPASTGLAALASAPRLSRYGGGHAWPPILPPLNPGPGCAAVACSFLPQFLPFLPLPPAAERPSSSPCTLLFDQKGFIPSCVVTGQVACHGATGQADWACSWEPREC